MPHLTRTLRWIDRDTRRRNREAAGLRSALPVHDIRTRIWGGVFRYTFSAKPVGVQVPEGCVVIAARRNEHGQYLPVLIKAFEGDRAGFASFPRLAHILGATELQIGLPHATMPERARCVSRLAPYGWQDLAALLSRPLVVAGRLDRSAIRATARAIAAARRAITGETEAACFIAALKGILRLARTELAVDVQVPASETLTLREAA